MGCGNNNNVHGGNCVCEVVRAIKDIQDAAVQPTACPPCTSCFLEPLGSLVSPADVAPADTRVFTLSCGCGEPFFAFFTGDGTGCVSIFFRVEEVFDNCCATLRVLKPLDNNGHVVNLACDGKINLSQACQVHDFGITNNCVTVDLSCFCAIQCIADVHLGICTPS